MKQNIVIILCLFLLRAADVLGAERPLRVTVVEFVNKTSDSSLKAAVEKATDNICHRLSETEELMVTDKTSTNIALSALDIKEADPLDKDQKVGLRLGKALRQDAVVVGSLDRRNSDFVLAALVLDVKNNSPLLGLYVLGSNLDELPLMTERLARQVKQVVLSLKPKRPKRVMGYRQGLLRGPYGQTSAREFYYHIISPSGLGFQVNAGWLYMPAREFFLGNYKEKVTSRLFFPISLNYHLGLENAVSPYFGLSLAFRLEKQTYSIGSSNEITSRRISFTPAIGTGFHLWTSNFVHINFDTKWLLDGNDSAYRKGPKSIILIGLGTHLSL